MCRFSGPVHEVESTHIFARDLDDGAQLLIYEMTVAFEAPVAMVLPLPVPADGPDDAVTFIDLAAHAHLFEQLERAVGLDHQRPVAAGGPRGTGRAPTLEVHSVGAYVASFVPRPADFARLDARFRLSPEVQAALPEYADWGFAVFQLAARARERARYHPMGLRFPRRDRGALYLPTGHVHDGTVSPRADFDHVLYAQVPADVADHLDWARSATAAGAMNLPCDAVGLAPDRPVYGRALRGTLPNTDAWLRSPGPTARLQGPHHRAWVRAPGLVSELPDDRRRRASARDALDRALATLADELPALITAHAAAWELAPMNDDTPVAAQGPVVALPAAGPCAVAFDIGRDRFWGDVRPTITLGFAARPEAARRDAIHHELTERLRTARARRGP